MREAIKSAARRVLDSKSKSWPNIFKPQLLSFKSLGLDIRITPSLSLPRATHIPPGRPKIDDRPLSDALFFDFLLFQDVSQFHPAQLFLTKA